MNSQKKPVSNVMVYLKGSQPTYSGKDGVFFANFSDAKHGSKIIVKEVSKPNYVVINHEEIFERWFITEGTNPWFHRVEIAHKDSLKNWQSYYKRLAEANLRKEFLNQLNLIKKSYKSDSISSQEYKFRIHKLELENKCLNSQITELSERLSMINRDFALSFVNKALNAYMIGDVQTAIKLIDSVNVVKGLEIATLNLNTEIKDIDVALNKKNQWVEAVKVKARFFNNQFNIDSAKFYFEKAVFYDSLNYNTVFEYGIFLKSRLLQLEKAIEYFSKALSLTENCINKAKLLREIGGLKRQLNGSLNDVSKNYFEALDLLLKKDSISEPESSLISSLLIDLGHLQKEGRHYLDAEESFLSGVKSIRSIAYSTKNLKDLDLLAQKLTELGQLRTEMRMYELAEADLNEALNITKSNRLADSISPIGQSLTLNSLGELYLRMNKPSMAERFIREAISVNRLLISEDSLIFTSILSLSLDLMGKCQAQKNMFIEADSCFRESLLLINKMFSLNPKAYRSELAMIYYDYATLKMSLGQYSLSMHFLLESLKIYRTLSFEKFEVFDVDVIKALNCISELYIKNKQYNKAEEPLIEALFLCYKLKYNWTDNYTEELFFTYRNLFFYSNQKNCFEDAELYLNETLVFCDKLIKEGRSDFIVQKVKLKKMSDDSIYNRNQSIQELMGIKKDLSTLNTLEFDSYSEIGISTMLGNLSYFLILERKFKLAKVFAEKGLTIDLSQTWIKANLALSLLLQGEFLDAKQIYLELKDEPYSSDKFKKFKNVFLKDFDELEQAGISHPDIIKIRSLLVN